MTTTINIDFDNINFHLPFYLISNFAPFYWLHIPIPEPYQAGPRDEGHYCWNGHELGAFRLPQTPNELNYYYPLLVVANHPDS